MFAYVCQEILTVMLVMLRPWRLTYSVALWL